MGMGRNEGDDCFGCLPWGKKPASSRPVTAPSALRPVSAAPRAGIRPKSGVRPKSGAKLIATTSVKSTGSSKAVRGIIKTAPEPAPRQWRSQVGVSDDSDSESERADSETTTKPVGLGATAFPAELEPIPASDRLGSSLGSNPSPHGPRGLAATPASRFSHSSNGVAPAANDAYVVPFPSSAPPWQTPMGDSASPKSEAKPDAATRLAELQQRYRATSASRNRPPPAPPPAALIRDERFRSEAMQCDSFSYDPSTHGGRSGGGAPASAGGAGGGGGARPHSLSPLSRSEGPPQPLIAAPGGGDPRRLDPQTLPSFQMEKKVMPFMHSGGALGGRTDSLTAAIPGSLPSVTASIAGNIGPASRDPGGAPAHPHSLLSGGPGDHRPSTSLQGQRLHPSTEGVPSLGPGLGSHHPHSSRPSASVDSDGFSFSAALRQQPGSRPGGLAATGGLRTIGAGGGAAHGTHHTTHGAAGYCAALATTPTSSMNSGNQGSRELGKPPSTRAAFGAEPEPDSSIPTGAADSSPAARAAAAMTAGGFYQDQNSNRHSASGTVAAATAAAAGAGPGGGSLFVHRPPHASSPLPVLGDKYAPAGMPTGLSKAPSSRTPSDDAEDFQGTSITRHQHQHQQEQQQQGRPQGERQQADRVPELFDVRHERPTTPALLVARAGEGRMSGSGTPAGAETSPIVTAAATGTGSVAADAGASAGGGGGGEGVSRAGSGSGSGSRANAAMADMEKPATSALQRLHAAKSNEEMLKSLLGGKAAFDFGGIKAGGGTAEELERFDRVTDAMSRLEDILGTPPLVPGRSLNARAGAREDALTDFSGSAPAHAHPAIGVKPW